MSTSMAIRAAEAAPFDERAAQDFADRIAGALDSGALAIMLSIGHRSGLLDTLARLPPSGSERIAQEAGLSERYVREWLATMTTGGVVRYEPSARTYHLPPEHAASLTRGGSLGNLAVYAQMVALLGAVQDKTLELLRTGEGARYDDYPCFHQIMAEDSDMTVVAGLFDTILPLAPGLEARLEAGIEVLDAGCGSGHALLAMAQRYPRSRFTGYDISADAIAHANAHAAEVPNARFAVRDLTHWDEAAAYDLITTFDAVHDQRDPQDFLRRLRRALKPGGVYLMQDIGGSAALENNLDFPMATMLYAVSCAHCTAVSRGQGGAGLGTMWGWETALAMLEEAGFSAIERHVLPHDPMNVWFVARA
jgi:SAM-dependent methyltransferase